MIRTDFAPRRFGRQDAPPLLFLFRRNRQATLQCNTITSMSIRILPDANAPTAAIELTITQSLPEYDIEEVAMPIPRDVDGILVTQGFRDLVDDARALLGELLSGSGLEVVQLTGAICPGNGVFRPGLWLVLVEAAAPKATPISDRARDTLNKIADNLRKRLQLS